MGDGWLACDKCSLSVALNSSNFVEKLCDEWVLSTSVCGTGSFSAHTATHSTSGSAYETQSFSTELRKTKKVPTNTWHKQPKKSNWHFPLHLIIYHLFAGVAELADAQASGACGSNIVWVQVPSPAWKKPWWYQGFFLLCRKLLSCKVKNVPRGCALRRIR